MTQLKEVRHSLLRLLLPITSLWRLLGRVINAARLMLEQAMLGNMKLLVLDLKMDKNLNQNLGLLRHAVNVARHLLALKMQDDTRLSALDWKLDKNLDQSLDLQKRAVNVARHLLVPITLGNTRINALDWKLNKNTDQNRTLQKRVDNVARLLLVPTTLNNTRSRVPTGGRSNADTAHDHSSGGIQWRHIKTSVRDPSKRNAELPTISTDLQPTPNLPHPSDPHPSRKILSHRQVIISTAPKTLNPDWVNLSARDGKLYGHTLGNILHNPSTTSAFQQQR